METPWTSKPLLNAALTGGLCILDRILPPKLQAGAARIVTSPASSATNAATTQSQPSSMGHAGGLLAGAADSTTRTTMHSAEPFPDGTSVTTRLDEADAWVRSPSSVCQTPGSCLATADTRRHPQRSHFTWTSRTEVSGRRSCTERLVKKRITSASTRFSRAVG